MGTSDPKPLSHGGISEAAAVATYGPEALEPVEPEGGAHGGPDGHPEPPEHEADPWDAMTTHAAIDTFIDGPDGYTRPEGWSSMTIAQKKEWLDNA